MLVIFVILLILLLIFLRYFPVRRKVLIEGIFKAENREYDLNRGEPFKSFVFEDFCKSCVEKWRRTGNMPHLTTLGPTCYGGIDVHSLNIGSIKPKSGDAVKMVVLETIFGRVRYYYFESSDFVWTGWYNEKDKQESEKAGFSDVEEYKKFRKQKYWEECVVEIMEKEGLTRQEAEIFECFGTFEIMDREAKRLGKTIAELDDAWHKRLRESDYCADIDGDYLAEQYIESKSLDPEVRAHLSKCSSCNLRFFVALHGKTDLDREKIDAELNLPSSHEIHAKELGITPEELTERIKNNMTLRWGHGEGCFSVKERSIYARTGNLPAERLSHTETCLGCQRMIEADRKDVVATGRIGGLAYGLAAKG